MKKYIVLLASLIVLNLQLTYSQNFQWAKGFGGSSFDGVNSVFTNDIGNNYITGGFRSVMATFDTITLSASGFGDVFLCKTNPAGNIIWAKNAGGNDPVGGDASGCIVENNNGDIFIAGRFYSSATFDTIGIISYGYEDAFIAKYNDSGKCMWVEKMGGNNKDYAGRVCLFDNQSVLVCGGFTSPTANFGTIDLFNNGGALKDKIFLAKYDDNGNCLWARQSTSGTAQALKIINNGAQIYMTGWFGDSLTISGNMLINNSIGYEDVFVAKFDMNGNLIWLKQAGGPSYDLANSICSDSAGNCFVTGYFNGPATFGGYPIISGSPQGDMFLAKYDSLGNCVWVKSLNCSGAAEGKDVISDGSNGVYVTGSFSGTAIFGSNVVSAISTKDMFVAHYDNSGNCLGIRNIANAVGYAISTNVLGSCVITGTYTCNTNFDSINLINKGYTDIFLTKIDAITGMSLPNKSANKNLIIYANPTTGKCNITVPDEFINESKLLLTIYNLQGLIIQQQELSMHDNNILLNLEAEAKGVYTATLSNGKKVYTGKIVFE